MYRQRGGDTSLQPLLHFLPELSSRILSFACGIIAMKDWAGNKDTFSLFLTHNCTCLLVSEEHWRKKESDYSKHAHLHIVPIGILPLKYTIASQCVKILYNFWISSLRLIQSSLSAAQWRQTLKHGGDFFIAVNWLRQDNRMCPTHLKYNM